MTFWLAGLLVAVVLLAWRQRRDEGPAAPESPDAQLEAGGADDAIDHAALEEAEREVRDLDTDIAGRPLDEQPGDDWGPGTSKGLHPGG